MVKYTTSRSTAGSGDLGQRRSASKTSTGSAKKDRQHFSRRKRTTDYHFPQQQSDIHAPDGSERERYSGNATGRHAGRGPCARSGASYDSTRADYESPTTGVRHQALSDTYGPVRAAGRQPRQAGGPELRTRVAAQSTKRRLNSDHPSRQAPAAVYQPSRRNPRSVEEYDSSDISSEEEEELSDDQHCDVMSPLSSPGSGSCDSSSDKGDSLDHDEEGDYSIDDEDEEDIYDQEEISSSAEDQDEYYSSDEEDSAYSDSSAASGDSDDYDMSDDDESPQLIPEATGSMGSDGDAAMMQVVFAALQQLQRQVEQLTLEEERAARKQQSVKPAKSKGHTANAVRSKGHTVKAVKSKGHTTTAPRSKGHTAKSVPRAQHSALQQEINRSSFSSVHPKEKRKTSTSRSSFSTSSPTVTGNIRGRRHPSAKEGKDRHASVQQEQRKAETAANKAPFTQRVKNTFFSMLPFKVQEEAFYAHDSDADIHVPGIPTYDTDVSSKPYNTRADVPTVPRKNVGAYAAAKPSSERAGVRARVAKANARKEEARRRRALREASHRKTTAQLARAVSNTTVDVLMVLDCTGSMTRLIDQAKARFEEVKDALLGMDLSPRFGFVGYRDIDDEGQIVIHPFVSADRWAEVHSLILGQTARGGRGDGPEDVAGAFHAASQMDWKSKFKIIIHIADAPCHGTQYHDVGNLDHFPDGDPAGRDPTNQLRSLARCGIDYTFLKLTPDTDIMLQHFATAYEHSSRLFRAVDLHDPADFLREVVESVRESTSSADTYLRADVGYDLSMGV
mmetsp:Transcript_7812/g.32862  ORF Transcript_7812/g.32862 Transcript_7812/m.32862 type:complete len:789 (-) Transcript_7812:63-2429(-)